MNPLVSVIMPAYNGEKYIGEAIESILAQTYSDWELIIVEDASTDNTLQVIKEYQDPRIRLFVNEKNSGIAVTTNRAISESKGKYLALLDDDDVAEKERLELQVNYLESHPEIDILGGRSTFMAENGDMMWSGGVPRYNPNYIKAVLLFRCMDFMNSTAMIRSDFVKKNKLFYRENCYGMQDLFFYMESSKVGKISSIEDFLLKHRLHDSNETDRNLKLFNEERRAKYAEFQKTSLNKSGYRLSEETMCFLNKVLAEQDGQCDSVQEMQQLYEVFCELISQGQQMNIDYLEELKHVCNRLMHEKINKVHLFM